MALGFDPYAVLGVSRDATAAQIAQARRLLSRQYHPETRTAIRTPRRRFDEVQRAFGQLFLDPAARGGDNDRASGQPGAPRVPGAATTTARPTSPTVHPASPFPTGRPAQPVTSAEVKRAQAIDRNTRRVHREAQQAVPQGRGVDRGAEQRVERQPPVRREVRGHRRELRDVVDHLAGDDDDHGRRDRTDRMLGESGDGQRRSPRTPPLPRTRTASPTARGPGRPRATPLYRTTESPARPRTAPPRRPGRPPRR